MRKNKIFAIRFSSEEFETIKGKLNGSTISEYIRNRLIYSDDIVLKLDAILYSVQQGNTNSIQGLNTDKTIGKGMKNIPQNSQKDRYSVSTTGKIVTYKHDKYDGHVIITSCSCDNIQIVPFSGHDDVINEEYLVKCYKCGRNYSILGSKIIEYLKNNNPSVIVDLEIEHEEIQQSILT